MKNTMTEFPYPGLRPFRPDETLIFFGREKQIDELLEKLESSRFLAILGPSGCGKSSLVNTGLIASLQMGLLASKGSRWQVVHMRPQSEPFYYLAAALAESEFVRDSHRLIDPTESNESLVLRLQTTLERGALGLLEVLERYPLPQDNNLLLVVDQFEEIFRYQRLSDSDKANAFVALLLHSARSENFPINIVITMRSDFLGNSAVFPGLPEAINQGLFFIPRLTREQIREAIERPAQVCGGNVDKTLVNHLLNSMVAGDDQLPVLQHALMQMWIMAGKKLTIADGNGKSPPVIQLQQDIYEKAGGLGNALSNHADEIYDLLTDKGKDVARYLFCALTERIDGGRDIRRPVTIREVAKLADVTQEEVIDVVEQFRHPDRCFLTPAVEELQKLDGESRIDISHESLIRQWLKLKSWVQEEAASAEMYHRLETNALRWESKSGDLLGNIELGHMVSWMAAQKPNAVWAERYGKHFSLAMLYFDESLREQKKKRKLARLKHVYLIPLGLLFAAAWGWLNSHTRYNYMLLLDQSQKARLQAQQAFDSDRIDEGLLFTLIANEADKKSLDANTGQTPSAGKMANVNESVISARGLLPAFSIEPRIKRIFDQFDGRVNAVAFSPDGNYLALSDQGVRTDSRFASGKVYVFDASDSRLLTALTEHTDSVSSITFLADGSLVSGGWDSKILWWPLSDGNYKTTDAPENILDKISRQSDSLIDAGNVIEKRVVQSLLATGEMNDSESLFAIVNKITKEEAQEITESELIAWQFKASEIVGVQVLPLGEILRKSADGIKELFSSMAIVQGGRYLILGTTQGRLILWDRAENGQPRIIMGPDEIIKEIKTVAAKVDEGVLQVAFSGELSGNSKNVFLCSLKLQSFETENKIGGDCRFQKGLENITILEGHEDMVLDVKFSFNGDLLASSGRNGELFLWKTAEAQAKSNSTITPFMKLRGHADWVRKVAFSPDDKLLISGAGNSRAILWSLSDQHILSTTLRGHTDEVWNLVYLSNGNLVSGGKDKTIKKWNLDTTQDCFPDCRPVSPVGYEFDPIIHFAFNPTNELLLSAERNGWIRAWKISDGQLVLHNQQKRSIDISEHMNEKLEDRLDGIALNNDASLLATSTNNGNLFLWYWDPSQGWKKLDIPEKLKDKLNSGSLKVTGWGGSMTFLSDETGTTQLAFGVQEEAGQGERSKYYIQLLTIVSAGEKTYKLELSQQLGEENITGNNGHTGEIVSLVWGGDGDRYLASGGDDNTVIIWKRDSENKWRMDKRLEGHSNRINTIKFNPEYKNIVASGSRDRTVRLWDVNSGQSIGVLRKHTDFVDQVAFSADGKQLASASDDKTVVVWNVDFDSYPEKACLLVGRKKISDEAWSAYLDSTLAEEQESVAQDICATI